MLKFIKVVIAGALIGLTGLLGVLFAKQQFEQSNHPQLVYTVLLVPAKRILRAPDEAANQLVEDFYYQVYQYTLTHSGTSYQEAVEAVLPMTATLPAQSVSVITRIENKGIATATRVRATFNLDRPITSLDVSSLEPFTLLKGGIGENSVTAEVDRIVSGDAVTIIITSRRTQAEKQLDQVVLTRPDRLRAATELANVEQIETLSVEKNDFSSHVTSFFPDMVFLLSEKPTIDVIVRSDQGAGVRLP